MIISLLLIFVMLLSVSTTFAADDDATLSSDEITEDVVASEVDDSSDQLSDGESSNVVTKDNFNDYFDEYGYLTSDAEELVFEGDFSELGISSISIDSDHDVKFTGKNATFKNIQFMIMQDDVTIDGFNFIADDTNLHEKLIYIIGADDVISNIVLSNNNIQFIAPTGADGYAIFAGAEGVMGSCPISGLQIINNNFTYVGTTDGTTVNNVIRVNGNDFDEDYDFETSDNITVQGNYFDIQIPSVNVYYDPVDWSAKTMAEGIVFYYCDDVKFIDNKVKMKYNNDGDSYDSLYVVSVYNDYMATFDVASGAVISNNEITGVGYNYIYGIRATTNDITITNNVINLSSDKNYAAGIYIDGPVEKGYVYNNTIDLKAPTSTYGIYAWGMNGGIEEVLYVKNTINLNSYLACGMEINQPDPRIINNLIIADGNFTYGIAASIRPDSDAAFIEDNTIVCLGNNEGFGSGDAILKTGSAGISTLGNAIIRNNTIYSTCVGVVSVDDGEVNLVKNSIIVVAEGNFANYAVLVTETDKFTMTNNNITFTGKTDGETVTNGIYIFDTEASISDNNFDLTIPAADIIYGPAPAYEETIIAEGIVIDYVDGLLFENNNVTVKYGDVVGYYDTIRAIDISNSDNIIVNKNNIDANGNMYIYALKVTGDNFTISNNEITSTSNYYTNGINIEGPATGIIKNNTISAISPGTSYPIYSGMNGQSVSTNITNNDVTGEAYYVVGVEAGGDKVIIDNNNINVKGNYTIGVGTHVEDLTVTNNNITSDASNEGNVTIWDGMGTDTMGIKVLTGNATIENNIVKTTGDYAIDMCGNNATITDNYLSGNKGVGDSAVANAANAVISGGSPELKTVLSAVDLYTVYDAGDVYYVSALDENGDPIKNATISLTVDGKVYNETTDNYGVASFVLDLNVGDYKTVISYAGNDTYGLKTIKGYIQVQSRVANIVSPASASVLLTAVKKGTAYYKITLKDDRGNVLAGEKVTITFNGKTADYVTDANGVVKFKLSASKVGTQKLTVKFDKNANYVADPVTATVKINKEATKLAASKKTFKAKVKTKKYTVTLKDSKGKAIKKVKVTIKIGKKTYKAKTNSKGKATFKVKKLTKKGTYKAKVKFAGNNLYKASSKTVKITVKK